MDKVKEAAAKLIGADDPLPLPDSREQLLALHQAARRRRDAAPNASQARAEAVIELARIEVQIARIERAMDPPLV